MTSLTDVFIGNAGATVEVLDDQTFDTSGTWVKPTGITFAPADVALIELWGGGGGGAKYGSANPLSLGGLGGDYMRFAVPISSLPANAPVVVGAGGAGATSDNGGWGGDTSFAGFTANGGLPGMPSDDRGWGQVVGALRRQPRIYGGGDGGSRLYGGLHPPGRSVHGGSGGGTSSSSSAPGLPGGAPGGGGGASGASGGGGAGAPGRVRVRIMRGLNQFEISEGPL